MAKRFVDTNLGRQPWFRKLKPKYKCAVRFLFDECDQAGVWEIDMETMNYFIAPDDGEITMNDLFENINTDKEDRIELLEDGKLWIPGFIIFQCGTLSKSSPAHKPIFSLLKRHKLSDRVLGRVSDTLQEKEKEMDKEKETEKEKPARKKTKPLELENGQMELATTYQEQQQQFKDQEPRTVFVAIRDFVRLNKPVFAEPYVDAWNIFAANNGLECVREITRDRREKIRIRTREPAFDFFKSLQAIKQNPFYTGDNDRAWKVDFNFLIQNETNYIKLIEKHKDGPVKP